MPELEFPDLEMLSSRGSCGKKNCTVIGSGVMASELGLEHTVLHFGGSGKPLVEDFATAAEGDVLPWMYNNMVAKIDGIGLLVMRLDPNRTSRAVLGPARIGGREVLTVTDVELYFRLYLPGFDTPIGASEPLKLALAPGHSTTGAYAFKEIAPAVLAEAGGAPILRVRSAGPVAVTVTPRQHVHIVDASRTRSTVAFDVALADGIGAVDGAMVAYIHNPHRPGDPIPVKELDLRSGRQRVTFDLAEYPGIAEAEKIYVETVGVKDGRHIWTMTKV